MTSDPAEEYVSGSCRKEASRAGTDRERVAETERDGEADVSSDSSIAGVGIRRLEWLLTVWPCSDVTDSRPATTNAPKYLMAFPFPEMQARISLYAPDAERLAAFREDRFRRAEVFEPANRTDGLAKP